MVIALVVTTWGLLPAYSTGALSAQMRATLSQGHHPVDLDAQRVRG